VLPAQVAEVMEQAAAAAGRHGLRAALRAHAGVGLVTAALSGRGAGPAAVTAALGEWRRLARAAGGHARLEWAPLAVKEEVAVWDEPGPDFRLMKAIKDRLDPRGILSPGRFVGGI
jgi:glycolate oxidase FAD binding subunit